MGEEKFIDEDWKESVAREKQQLDNKVKTGSKDKLKEPADSQQKDSSPPDEAEDNSDQGLDINFINYLSSLVYQAMIFLGEVPHPVTHTIEENHEQAKLMIDTLVILRGKTKGNLNQKESDFLNTSIYELQMKYVEKSQKTNL